MTDSSTLHTEDVAPPKTIVVAADPQVMEGPHTGPLDLTRPGARALGPVAQQWAKSCTGGDSFQNNCAHFLSNAFIKAGFAELLNNNPHINARCPPARRPVRAMDMNNWFASKATTTRTTVARNTGWWAVFQHDTAHYCCGHVALLDSDGWKVYGTGWYGSWVNQTLYQW